MTSKSSRLLIKELLRTSFLGLEYPRRYGRECPRAVCCFPILKWRSYLLCGDNLFNCTNYQFPRCAYALAWPGTQKNHLIHGVTIWIVHQYLRFYSLKLLFCVPDIACVPQDPVSLPLECCHHSEEYFTADQNTLPDLVHNLEQVRNLGSWLVNDKAHRSRYESHPLNLSRDLRSILEASNWILVLSFCLY